MIIMVENQRCVFCFCVFSVKLWFWQMYCVDAGKVRIGRGHWQMLIMGGCWNSGSLWPRGSQEVSVKVKIIKIVFRLLEIDNKLGLDLLKPRDLIRLYDKTYFGDRLDWQILDQVWIGIHAMFLIIIIGNGLVMLPRNHILTTIIIFHFTSTLTYVYILNVFLKYKLFTNYFEWVNIYSV